MDLIFNTEERAVLRTLADASEPLTVVAIASACWPDGKVLGDLEPAARGATRKHEGHGHGVSSYRRTCNAIRRLAKYGYVDKVGRGTYTATDRGRTWNDERRDV